MQRCLMQFPQFPQRRFEAKTGAAIATTNVPCTGPHVWVRLPLWPEPLLSTVSDRLQDVGFEAPSRKKVECLEICTRKASETSRGGVMQVIASRSALAGLLGGR